MPKNQFALSLRNQSIKIQQGDLDNTIQTNQTQTNQQSLIGSSNIIHGNYFNSIVNYQSNHVMSQYHQYKISIINLMVTYHRKLKLNKYVIFQSVSIINQYITHQPIMNKSGQLAITSLILAQKKFSAKKLKIKKWLEMLQLDITQSLIVELQYEILTKLDYSLDNWITCLEIAYMVSQYIRIDPYTFMLYRYLLELSFYLNEHYTGLQYLISISCFKLSCHFLEPHCWDQKFNLTRQSVNDCSSRIFIIMMEAKDNYNIVYEKFKKSAYQRVSLIQIKQRHQQPKTAETSSEDDISLDRSIECHQVRFKKQLRDANLVSIHS